MTELDKVVGTKVSKNTTERINKAIDLGHHSSVSELVREGINYYLDFIEDKEPKLMLADRVNRLEEEVEQIKSILEEVPSIDRLNSVLNELHQLEENYSKYFAELKKRNTL